MKPLVASCLAKARRSLTEARAIVGLELSEAAGRAAYLAAYNAAQAYIFHCTGKAAKTHSGVRSEFARLVKDDPRIDRGMHKCCGCLIAEILFTRRRGVSPAFGGLNAPGRAFRHCSHRNRPANAGAFGRI